jgi:DNA-binding transcriptional regulator YiaG
MKQQRTLRVGRFEVTVEYEATRIEHDGSWGISDAEWGRLEIAAACAVLSHAESINGDELKFARKAMGLRQPDLAALLDVAPETVSRWENDKDPIRRQTQLAVLLFLEHTARFGVPTLGPTGNDNTLAPVRIVA